jgi:ribonuclease Z
MLRFSRVAATPARVYLPAARGICSGRTGGINWVNAHADMPHRPPQTHKGVTLTFLGTGSGIPCPGRGMSSSLLTAHDRCAHYLFDCGEGTQEALSRASQWHPGWLWRGGVFISHLHGDHVFGLPSLLADLLRRDGQRLPTDASGPLRVFGPPGLHRFLSAALGASKRDAELAAMPVEVNELHWEDAAAWRSGGRGAPPPAEGSPAAAPAPAAAAAGGLPLRVLRPERGGAFLCVAGGGSGRRAAEAEVRAAPLVHTVPTLGYVYSEAEEAHLDPAALRARGIPIPFGGPGEMAAAVAALKAGRSVEMPTQGGGAPVTVAPGEALTRGAPGRKVAVFSDMSRAPRVALALAAGADLLVHEATCAPGEEEKAEARGHSTPAMAGRVAAAMDARALLLTHFGRALMIGARVNEMWALGLPEALAAAAARRREEAPHQQQHREQQQREQQQQQREQQQAGGSRWAGAHGAAAAAMEARDVVASTALAEAALAAAARAQPQTQPAPVPPTGDYAFPRVADAPSSAALADAAAAAFKRARPDGKALAVLCARDFMRVVVPRAGEEWGVLGPLKAQKGRE